MPSSLFTESNGSSVVAASPGAGSLEEQRALQLAFELSMLGLDANGGSAANGSSSVANGVVSAVANGVVVGPDSDGLQQPPSSVFEEARSKKSQNMTECVPVPSSEHVAEIVGRQGEFYSTTLQPASVHRALVYRFCFDRVFPASSSTSVDNH